MPVKRLPKRVINRRPKSAGYNQGSSNVVDSPMSSESSGRDVVSKIRGFRKRGRSKSRA